MTVRVTHPNKALLSRPITLRRASRPAQVAEQQRKWGREFVERLRVAAHLYGAEGMLALADQGGPGFRVRLVGRARRANGRPVTWHPLRLFWLWVDVQKLQNRAGGRLSSSAALRRLHQTNAEYRLLEVETLRSRLREANRTLLVTGLAKPVITKLGFEKFLESAEGLISSAARVKLLRDPKLKSALLKLR